LSVILLDVRSRRTGSHRARKLEVRHEPIFSVRANRSRTTELFTDCTDPGGRKVSDFLFRHEVSIRRFRGRSLDTRARAGSDFPGDVVVVSSSSCLGGETPLGMLK
jgi:hypothetical protein